MGLGSSRWETAKSYKEPGLLLILCKNPARDAISDPNLYSNIAWVAWFQVKAPSLLPLLYAVPPVAGATAGKTVLGGRYLLGSMKSIRLDYWVSAVIYIHFAKADFFSFFFFSPFFPFFFGGGGD